MSAASASDRRPPRVSIGLPTYNRADRLARAIDSALGQTFRDIELVISDNGSTDGTEALCGEHARRDARVRYMRQPVNRGPIANFNAVIDALEGEYALLLADDDWLDADYVERCLAELQANPGLALVGGLARYFDQDGNVVRDGLEVTLVEDDPVARVRHYLGRVDDNGIFYGLCRREALQRAAPMHDVLGSDWLLIAGIVFGGKAKTVRSTTVNRSMGGTSRTTEQILRTMSNVARLERRMPFLYTACTAFADIAWKSEAYGDVGPVRRFGMAARMAPSAMRWKGSAWLVLGPPLLRLLQKPAGRWLQRPFEWALRRLGITPTELPPL